VQKRDWTLLVIGAAGGKKVSPVQLQKALFLVSKTLKPKQRQTSTFYRFKAYDYGPFCSEVYSDAEALKEAGLVSITCQEFSFRHYAATDDGQKKAQELRGELDPEVAAYLDDLVLWVRSLSFVQLVQAIYKMYPAMKANSIFQEPA
jgi:uncharacterized phage-associated protein